MCFGPNVTGLVVLCAVLPACITDTVPANEYVTNPSALSGDAAVDAATNAQPDAGSVSELDGAAQQPDSLTNSEAGTDAPSGEGVDNGPCDLTGSWVITQHGVYQALGVKQTSMSWYYYELEQNGGDLTVTKGLACGGQVIPLDLLGASVNWPDAWPATTAKNSHAGRRGTVTTNGTNCTVSFELAFTILGATVSYYSDPSHDLPTLDQMASGSTPGWEDWDNDGEPGISFNTGGFATGVRYSVQRVYNDWSDGAYSAGATVLKLASMTQTDESVLGATSDLIKTLSSPDSDPSTGFTQFGKIDATQAQGDDDALCATARMLAPMLTPEANSK